MNQLKAYLYRATSKNYSARQPNYFPKLRCGRFIGTTIGGQSFFGTRHGIEAKSNEALELLLVSGWHQDVVVDGFFICGGRSGMKSLLVNSVSAMLLLFMVLSMGLATDSDRPPSAAADAAAWISVGLSTIWLLVMTYVYLVRRP
jgi:hypothetical protein